MTTEDMLVEILAIQQYEHDHSTDSWPLRPGHAIPWRSVGVEDRQLYRDMIKNAVQPEELYS
jgi:hypothetical protein